METEGEEAKPGSVRAGKLQSQTHTGALLGLPTGACRAEAGPQCGTRALSCAPAGLRDSGSRSGMGVEGQSTS